MKINNKDVESIVIQDSKGHLVFYIDDDGCDAGIGCVANAAVRKPFEEATSSTPMRELYTK